MKRLAIIFGLCLSLLLNVFPQSQTHNRAGSYSDPANTACTTPLCCNFGGSLGNVQTINQAYIGGQLVEDGSVTPYIFLKDFRDSATNAAFSVPSNATVDSIVVFLVHHCSSSPRIPIRTLSLKLLKAGSAVGTDMFNCGGTTTDYWHTGSVGGTDTVRNYQGMGLWGTTWTPAEINNSGFGFELSVETNSRVFTNHFGQPWIDNAGMTVYFHIPSSFTHIIE